MATKLPAGPAGNYPPTAEMLKTRKQFVVVLPAILLVVGVIGILLVSAFVTQQNIRLILMGILGAELALVAFTAFRRRRQLIERTEMLARLPWKEQSFDIEHLRTVKVRTQKSYITAQPTSGPGADWFFDLVIPPSDLEVWKLRSGKPIWSVVEDDRAVLSLDNGSTLTFSNSRRSAS